MKKNVMMRVASLLMVCVLATTCGISGTFAKYVTKDSGSDSARVAKWGVVVDAKNFDMFTEVYETEPADPVIYSGAYSVDSYTDDDVMAPGTSGEFAQIKITGQPEVATKVTIAATVALTDNWKDGADQFYCPIVVTVGTTAIDGAGYTSAADFVAAIESALEGKSAVYGPNTNLADHYDNTNLDLAWSWPFSTGDVNDIRDTALGDRAAAATSDAEALKLSIAIDIIVEQVD